MHRVFRLLLVLTFLVGALMAFTGHVLAQDMGELVPPAASNPLEGVTIDPTLAAWQLILGVMASIITTIVNRLFPGITPDDALKRGITTVVCCILVAAADVLVRGVFTGANLLASLVFVFAGAIGFYNQWFKTSTLAARIEGKRI